MLNIKEVMSDVSYSVRAEGESSLMDIDTRVNLNIEGDDLLLLKVKEVP